MDPVINSLTQSALLRSLKDTKTNASSFRYGMKDNIPPFSLQKVVVKPYNNPSKTSQDTTHKFRVPEYGHLNRAYLRIRTKNYNLKIRSTELEETDTANIFTVNSTAPNTDSDYEDFKKIVRIPWFHDSQVGTDPLKGQPFGAGGCFQISPGGNFVDPTTGNTQNPASSVVNLTADTTIHSNYDNRGHCSNAWNVLNVLDSFTLKSNERILEHVYGETIPAEVVKMNSYMRDFFTKGMIGWCGGDDIGVQLDEPAYEQPWDPSACHRDAYGRLSNEHVIYHNQVHIARNQHADFIVPVTLSCLKHVTKNLQTRVLENLELEVNMKDLGRGFNLIDSTHREDAIKNHDVELVLHYHNWHDNIESQLRGMNYKETIPTSLMLNSWFREPGPFKVTSNTEKLVIPLTCRNLVSEIEIVARSLNALDFAGITSITKNKSDYTFMGRNLIYNVELVASGKTLWDAKNIELTGVDSMDYDLNTKRSRANDCGYGGKTERNASGYRLEQVGKNNGYFLNDGENVRAVSGYTTTQTGVEYDFGDNMTIMRFALDTTDEFFAGGLGLQTLDNPRLIIKPPANAEWVHKEVEFNVYLKYYDIAQINATTGRIVKTLNV